MVANPIKLKTVLILGKGYCVKTELIMEKVALQARLQRQDAYRLQHANTQHVAKQAI